MFIYVCYGFFPCYCAGITFMQLEFQTLEDLRAQVDTLRKELDEKVEVLQNLEVDNQTLMIKELNSNCELQDARKAAIKVMYNTAFWANTRRKKSFIPIMYL